MYLRRTQRRLASGQKVGYLQIAQKYRDPETGTPRDKILVHLGREDKIDREQIQRLIRSLSRFLDRQEQAEAEAALAGLREITVERSVSMGSTWVLEAMWKRLELDQVLSEALSDRNYSIDIERLIFAMVANRCIAPRSKLGMEEWVGRKVHVEALDQVEVHALYRAMDFLLEAGEDLQKNVFFNVATLLNLEVDLVLFDTTSTYFEIEDEDDEEEGLRRRGHSKDRRPDLPQVVIGLAVTKEGIPVRCWTWPGNTSDAKTVDQVQSDLAGWKLTRVLWVADRGMSGEAQRKYFQRGLGQMVVGEKLRSNSAVPQEALQRPGRFQKVSENLEVKDVVIETDGERRRFLITRNPRRAERDRHYREEMLAELEIEIERVNRAIERNDGAHTKAACRLKTSRRFGRYIRELKSGQLRIDRTKLREEERLDGKHLLTTTDFELPAAELALAYRQLNEVERSWRTLKSEIDLRPVYHRLETRIEAHVLLCWLSLLLIRVVEREAGKSWHRVASHLDEIHLVKVSSKDGEAELVTRLTPEQSDLLKTLEVSPPPMLKSLSSEG